MQNRHFGYESMGTRWNVTLWDDMGDAAFEDLRGAVIRQSEEFDASYSRFIPSSLVWKLSQARGVTAVPGDLVTMLRLYEQLHDLSGGACNPLVGFTLSDLGYDAEYTLAPKEKIRPVPDMHEALRIVDDEHIELFEPVLLDLGAMGKGYMVDRISASLDARGVRRFLVDGSGDIFYRGNGEPIRAGLEHPEDPRKAIGVLELLEGAFCGSGGNRRTWSGYHHIIDPRTLHSPPRVLATWVQAPSATIADALATCLFLTGPEPYRAAWPFEYCIMNDRLAVERSGGFRAQLF